MEEACPSIKDFTVRTASKRISRRFLAHQTTLSRHCRLSGNRSIFPLESPHRPAEAHPRGNRLPSRRTWDTQHPVRSQTLVLRERVSLKVSNIRMHCHSFWQSQPRGKGIHGCPVPSWLQEHRHNQPPPGLRLEKSPNRPDRTHPRTN